MKSALSYSPLLKNYRSCNVEITTEHQIKSVKNITTENIIDTMDKLLKKIIPIFYALAIPYLIILMFKVISI